jgi:hypothetical protein
MSSNSTGGSDPLELLKRQVLHDLRSPLTALQIVRKDLNGLPSDTLELIDAAIGRLEKLVGTLSETRKP